MPGPSTIMSATEWDYYTLATTPPFSFAGQCLQAKVLKVYDGDTVTLAVLHGPRLNRFPCRLAGVNAPELHTSDPGEKAAGKRAQAALETLLLGRVVLAHCGAFDKYGRLLVDIECEGLSVSAWLLDNGHAIPYDGGRRLPWTDWPDEAKRPPLGV
jgi:micrococcal nuclease